MSFCCIDLFIAHAIILESSLHQTVPNNGIKTSFVPMNFSKVCEFKEEQKFYNDLLHLNQEVNHEKSAFVSLELAKFYIFGHSVSWTFARLNFSIFPFILSFLNWNAYLIDANFIPMLTWFQNSFYQNLLHICWANLFMHIFGVHYDI